MIRPYGAADAAAVSEVIRTTMVVSNVTDYSGERLSTLLDYFSPEKVAELNRRRHRGPQILMFKPLDGTP